MNCGRKDELSRDSEAYFQLGRSGGGGGLEKIGYVYIEMQGTTKVSRNCDRLLQLNRLRERAM